MSVSVDEGEGFQTLTVRRDVNENAHGGLMMAGRSRAPAVRHDEFVFWVRRPSATYTFSLQHDRRIDDPYDEHQSLGFLVECLSPDRFKGREAEAMFFAQDDLTAGSALRRRKPAEPILAVGSIRATRSRFEISGFLPPEVCWQIGAAMAAGTITSMGANAHWTTPSHAYLNSISFRGPEFDPVTYLG
jgi:hypothetical protein